MKKKILLIGGGGHCRSVLDCLISFGTYTEIGIIEKEKKCNESVMDVNVVGTDSDLPALYYNGWTDAFITLGSIGNTENRKRIYYKLKEIGFNLPIIADRSAVIGKNVNIGEGTFIGKMSVINSGAKVGNCAIINTCAVVEHDCVIGNFVHVSPGATLCGEVVIGDDSHIGANSVVRQQIIIGSNTLIGIGSVVVKDIPSNSKAYGNPCKVVEK